MTCQLIGSHLKMKPLFAISALTSESLWRPLEGCGNSLPGCPLDSHLLHLNPKQMVMMWDNPSTHPIPLPHSLNTSLHPHSTVSQDAGMHSIDLFLLRMLFSCLLYRHSSWWGLQMPGSQKHCSCPAPDFMYIYYKKNNKIKFKNHTSM